MTSVRTAPTHDQGREASSTPTGPAERSSTAGSYRYPGSPPFRDTDLDRRLFKGRDAEANKVFHSILSSNLFLLYALSGMGKSSLLNAGVMYRLRDRGFWPVTVRLNDTTGQPVESIQRQLTETAGRDPDIELGHMPGLQLDATASLWDVLGGLEVWRDDKLQQLVLIFDQFEELFTLEWDEDVRERFIAELGDVVRGHRSVVGEDGTDDVATPVPAPNIRIVIVIREDSLGELEALADDIPQVLQHRFRLGPLTADQAEAAIRDPAVVADGELDSQPFVYTDEAATEILQFLQDIEGSSPAGRGGSNDVGRSVDPSQLQIICHYIERRVVPAKHTEDPRAVVEIASSDLGGSNGLRSILGDFYRRTIDTFPEAQRRRVRELCERGLIRNGRRHSVELEEIDQQFSVPAGVLDQLVDHRLLRAEPRVGSIYYELAHDTLVKPILADRARREAEAARRRRRRLALGLTAVALIAAVLLALVLWSSSGSGDTPVTPLVLGRSQRGSVDQSSVGPRFTIAGLDQPAEIVVEPIGGVPGADGGLNPAVELRSAAGAGSTRDQLGGGQPERMVVPATAGSLEVAVRSNDGSSGAFEITLRELGVVPLRTSETHEGSIAEPGSLAVFSVDGDGDSFVEIRVAPKPAPVTGRQASEDDPAAKEQLLDVEFEVIDPSGVGRSFDKQGAGGIESTTIGGAEGQHLIVARGYQSTTGLFDLTATSLVGEAVTAGEPFSARVEPDTPVEVAIDVPDAGMTIVVSPEPDFDPVLEIIDPRGAARELDLGGSGGTETATLSVGGRHVLRISGYQGSAGAFDLTAAAVRDLAVGRSVTASAPAVFEVAVDSGQLLAFTAESEDSDGVLGVEVLDADGAPSAVVGPSTPPLPGDPVSVIVGGDGVSGTYQIVVSSTEPRREVTASLAAVEIQQLADGATVETVAPAVFEVAVDSDQLLAFTADSDTVLGSLDVQVGGPGGFDGGLSSFGSSPYPGDPVTVTVGGGRAGTYRIMVSSTDPRRALTASLATAEVHQLADGATATATAPAVFEVAVDSDELLALTATADAAAGVLDLQVNDPDGFGSGGPVRRPRLLPDELPPDLVARLPSEVAELFADGLPETVDEAAAMLSAAGLLDDVIDVVRTDPDAAQLLSGTPTEGAGPTTVVIGGGTRGTYQVIVTAAVPGTEVTATLGPVAARTLSAAEPVTTAAPVALEIAVGGGELLAVTAEPVAGAALLEVRLISGDGFSMSPIPWASSSVPGAPATILVGGDSAAEYHVVVTSSDATTEVRATVAAVAVRPLPDGQTVGIAAPAVFEVVIGDGQVVDVTAVPGAGRGSVEILVYGPDGYAFGPSWYGASSVPGGPATATVGADGGSGAHRVVINATGADRTVTATVSEASSPD